MLPQFQFPPELYCMYCTRRIFLQMDGWASLFLSRAHARAHAPARGQQYYVIDIMASLTWAWSVRQCRCRWSEGAMNPVPLVQACIWHLPKGHHWTHQANIVIHHVPKCMHENESCMAMAYTVTHMYSSVLVLLFLNTAGP